MTTKKPFIKRSVGAQYTAFNTPGSDGQFDLAAFEKAVKQEVVKTIGVTENEETNTVTASGKMYATVSQRNGTEIAMDVVAFDPQTLSRMRAETNTGGLVKSGEGKERPFFAYGYVEKKDAGNYKYIWYPKCQLVSNTKDIADGGESFSEQNDTLTIRAYAFDDLGNDHVYIDSEFENVPEGITEDKFFAKPITTIEGLTEGA